MRYNILRKPSHLRLGLISGLLTIGLVVGVVGYTPALAFSCPTGSGTWYGSPYTDGNGNHITEVADDYGSGADTCIAPAASGSLTVTQANTAKTVYPTSYPSVGYGCGQSYCTSGWTSKLWSDSSMTLSGSLNTSKVPTGSEYDGMIDNFFTTSTQYYNSPNEEIEIVMDAVPSAIGLGDCVSTSCGAKEVTIDGTQWWMSERTVSEGWPDYFFVRNTLTTSFSGLSLEPFYSTASASGMGPSLGTYNLGYVGWGSELWENGLNLQLGTTSATNLP